MYSFHCNRRRARCKRRSYAADVLRRRERQFHRATVAYQRRCNRYRYVQVLAIVAAHYAELAFVLCFEDVRLNELVRRARVVYCTCRAQ